MNAESGMNSVDQDSVYEQLRSRVSSSYNTTWKRVISLTIAVPALVVLSPLGLVLALGVFLDSGLPVFYRAERGGLNGKPFSIFKFRTMVVNADQLGGGTTALKDPRITKVGAVLRRTKMDELPQLLNIIRGEMCFVGPRPELTRYTSQYKGPQEFILRVRPGITDMSSLKFIHLDQVVGEGDADAAYERAVLPQKNLLRIRYVMEMSPLTDLRLFLATCVRVARVVPGMVFGGRNAHGIH